MFFIFKFFILLRLIQEPEKDRVSLRKSFNIIRAKKRILWEAAPDVQSRLRLNLIPCFHYFHNSIFLFTNSRLF